MRLSIAIGKLMQFKDPHFGGTSFRYVKNAFDILTEAGTDFMNNSNRQLEWQQPGIQV